MATVNTTTIFPSASFISTDGNGDLQEVLSNPQTNGSITHDGLTFTLVNAGALSPAPSLEIKEDAGVTGIEFSASANSVVMSVQTIAGSSASFDSLTSDGITYKAEAIGDSGIVVTINESQVADAMSFASGVLTIDLDNTIGNKTQGDIADLYALAGASIKDNIDITITDHAGVLASALSAEPLIGGNDAVPATTIASYTQQQVLTAFAGSDQAVRDVVGLTIADAGANLVSVLNATNFNGVEASVGSLDIDSDYILIKRTDLHDLDDSEKNDGRKFMWGIIHQAESVFNALADKPDNFTISKSNPASSDNGTALRQTYTITAKYGITNLDLKAEA
jgi:hypothetical protein